MFDFNEKDKKVINKYMKIMEKFIKFYFILERKKSVVIDKLVELGLHNRIFLMEMIPLLMIK